MKTTITPTEIKRDDNFLCSLELPDSLHTYLTYLGGDKVQYHAFLKGELLFEGKDFKPAPAYAQDSLECILSLLGFLTVQKGDTDDEYFAKYTPAQLAWAASFDCEQLKGYVSDFDHTEKQYRTQAKRYFKKHFKTN